MVRIHEGVPGVPRISPMQWCGSIWTHPSNKGERIHALARAVKCQVRGRLLNAETVVPLGLHSEVYYVPGARGANGFAYFNPPDHAMWLFWLSVLRSGDLFVDVGANVGIYTILASEIGCRVIAYEPNPKTLPLLMRNLRRNELTVDVRARAVDAQVGTASFEGDDGPRSHISRGPSESSREVETTTLDVDHPSALIRGLKIDVEGAERRVLKGAERLLREGRVDYIQLEWNNAATTNLGEDRSAVASLLAESGLLLFAVNDFGRLEPLADSPTSADVVACTDFLAEPMRARPSERRVPRTGS